MSAGTYQVVMRVIAFALAGAIAVSIVVEAPLYVPVVAVMLALVAASLLRRLVKETMTDERTQRIFEQATVAAYRVYTVVTATVVLVAMMLRSSLPPWAGIAAETLAYSLCGLMIIHLAAYRYHSRKF